MLNPEKTPMLDPEKRANMSTPRRVTVRDGCLRIDFLTSAADAEDIERRALINAQVLGVLKAFLDRRDAEDHPFLLDKRMARDGLALARELR